MILLICGICSCILLLISFIVLYRAKKIKIQRIDQNNKIIQKIGLLKIDYKNNQALISIQRQEINNLLEQKNKLNDSIKKEKDNLDNYYENLKQQANQSYEQYIDTLDKCYVKKEKEFNNNIQQLKEKQTQVENQLAQIKRVYQAATAARLRQQEDEEKWSFYRIRLTDKQTTDISRLQEWKEKLYDPTIVSKIIWSTYILKPASDLCNRVLGSKPVCGIYKITNKATGEIYIGQSVNIAQRWKAHIKCGLGIDASSTNKLYNIMQHTGVWNFTFEVLQKCSRDKLNEKERFWIEMYQSNKVGMNITKGNK